MVGSVLLSLGILVLAGCRTKPVPPSSVSKCPTGGSYPATPVYFREILASVPVEGAHQVYQNLHVGLAAFVTARNAAVYDTVQAQILAHRLEPKVSTEVLKALTDSPTISPHKLDHVRDDVLTKAQSVADENFAQWPEAAPYAIELEIVSMYWTDSTVGRHDLGSAY